MEECANCGHAENDHKVSNSTGEPYCSGDGREDGEWACDCEEFEEDDE